MRIVLDALEWQKSPRGYGKAAWGLYRACAQLESPPEVVALYRRRLACPPPDGVQAVRAGGWLPRRYWRQSWLPRWATRHRADAVHYITYGLGAVNPRPTPTTVISLLDVLPLEVPQRLNAYLADGAAQDDYRSQVQRAIDAADGVLTCSEYSKAQILANFRCHVEPEVIYLGSNLPSPRASGPPNALGEYFLYLGGYDARKGVEPLARVFVRLYREGRVTCRLVFVGQQRPVSDAFAEALADGQRIGAIVELGFVSEEDLAHLLTHAVALAYPSKYEGFGLPPLEAMTLGCPVITTRFTSLPEVCGDAALYADPDDEEDLAQALVTMHDDAELRRDLSERGKARAARFQWEASARKYMDWLSALVAEPRARGRRAGT